MYGDNYATSKGRITYTLRTFRQKSSNLIGQLLSVFYAEKVLQEALDNDLTLVYWTGWKVRILAYEAL